MDENQNKNVIYPPTFIKDVAIELHHSFQFDNRPYKESGENPKWFVGRRDEIKKFKSMLAANNGVFLVTGYRGMGKTSFVNEVLRELKEDRGKPVISNPKNDFHVVTITIAQRQPTDGEILRLMVAAVREKCKSHLAIPVALKQQERWRKYFLSAFVFTGIFLLAFLFKPLELTQLFVMPQIGWGSYAVLEVVLRLALLLSVLITLGLYIFFIRTGREPDINLFSAIDTLFRRCHAATSLEKEVRNEVQFENLGAKLAFGGSRETENYPVASSKEIEHELRIFLEKAKAEKNLQFFFVFDELDKVEQGHQVHVDAMLENQDVPFLKTSQGHADQLRERKEVIMNIIASMKNFLTTAPSPFIFIAGREMFDASMADIADRQSSLSSIFTYVFYIESLLKEKVNDSSSLSAGIEEYLFRILYGVESNGKSLYEPTPPSDEEKKKKYEQDYLKVNLLMQSFVTYITYRTNGSPKKLKRLIEEFVRVDVKDEEVDEKTFWPNEANEEHKKNDTTTKIYYLYFNYRQQQRLGFINYLYRPFLVKYGRSFKKYSDTLIVSTSYLFDHLLKFHPFAFSLSHLELIPEVLSTSRAPVLREHIKKIVDYLSANHIKETEIGLFDYKFYSKTINEIVCLSKVFEEESAAFNFTLDEAYLIKQHVQRKLRELRSGYERLPETEPEMSRVIFSIAHLNGVLGDLYFFDQEYDDAIIAYSDVIRPIRSLDMETMNLRDFVLLIKYKLKLGLTFEKIKSFDEALALYTDATQEAKRFIYFRLSKFEIPIALSEPTDRSATEPRYFSTASLSDLLQVVNQAFLAKMVLQEKMSVGGITAERSVISLGGFLRLSEAVAHKCGSNPVIISNFFLQLGNLLYFKNVEQASSWTKTLHTEDYLPKNYKEDIAAIGEGHKWYGSSAGESRRPTLAINFYCLGLKYLLEGRCLDTFGKLQLQMDTPLMVLDYLTDTSFNDVIVSLPKICFKYIGIYLSHIGDCLLSMLEAPVSAGFTVSEIVDVAQLKTLLNDLKLFDLLREIETTNCIKDPEDRKRLCERYGCGADGNLSADDYDIIRSQIEQLEAVYKTEGFKRLQQLEKRQEVVSVMTIMQYYYLSAYYFKKSGRLRSASFQFRKILYLIRLVVGESKLPPPENETFVAVIERIIVRPIIALSSETAHFSDRHDTNKFVSLLGENLKEKKDGTVFIRNNTSNFPDTREAVLLFSHIKLRLCNVCEAADSLIRPDNLVATQYIRLLELTFAAKYFEKKLEDRAATGGSCAGKDADQNLLREITGYVHSLLSIISIMDIYDNDYLVGNSFLAYHHFRLARFLDLKDGDRNHLKISKEDVAVGFKLAFDRVRDSHVKANSDPCYHYELAATLYERALSLHSGRDEYRKAIEDILYLEDDLNDASYHFGAAMDRYLLVNRKLKDSVRECRLQMPSTTYSIDRYSSSRTDGKNVVASGQTSDGAKGAAAPSSIKGKEQ